MVFWEAIFLGLVQGVSEFLPISSTAHLILLERFFRLSPGNFGLAFDVVLHLGTLLSLLLLFGRDFSRLLLGFGRGLWRGNYRSSEFRLTGYLLGATVPAALLGFLWEEKVASSFRDPALIVLALVAGSALFYLAERVGKPAVTLAQLGWTRSLFLGLAQALALIPGVSRSGITISAGLWLRMKREDAGYFTFLMSAPIILGAGVKQVIEIYQQGLLADNLLLYFLGFAAAALSGYFCIKYFLNFLKKHSLLLFIYYRLAVALGVVLAVKFLGW